MDHPKEEKKKTKKQNIELLFDPAISLQGTQTKVLKEGIWTDTYILMSIATVSTISKRGKQT